MIVEITYDTNSYTAEYSVTEFVVEISYAAASGGGSAWGDITGTLSNQTDLQAALNAKQSTGNYLTTNYSFSNANGVTFGTNGNTVTASVQTNYQSTGNYLTTARASNDAIGLNTAITQNGVSMTANSSGLSLNFPAFLTTAAQSNHSHNFATTTTNGASVVVGTANSAGVTIGVPSFLTTAMASNASTQFVQGNAAFAGTNASGTIASNGISISVAPGGGAGDGYNIIAAGGSTANTTGTIIFSNSNGVSFGLNGGTVTATVATNYQSQGAYLTTARASTDAVGLNTALTANGVSWTVNSSGLSLNVPAFLTTAAQSNHSHNFATTTTNGASIVVGTANSAGATIGVPSFLTTAMASNAATISNINVSGGTTSSNLSALNFVNSNGVSWSLDTASKIYATVATNYQSQGAYLTTARASNDAIGLNTALTGNGVTWTVNSSGLSLNVPAFLTTAMQSNAATISNINISGGTTSSNLSAINFVNSNGVSWSLDTASKVYATVKTDYQSSNPNYITSQTNQSLGIYGSSQTVGQSSSSTVDARSISFVGQGIASVGLSGGSVLISVPAGGGAGDGYNIIAAGGSTANTTGTIVFSNSNGISFGLNGATITANVYNGTLSQFEPYPLITNTAVSSHTANSIVMVPFVLMDDMAVSRVNLIKSFNINTTSSSNSSYSGSYIQSQSFTLWSRQTGTNSGTLATAYTTSVSFGVSSSLTSNSISMGVSYLSQANSTSWATSSWSSTSAGLNLTGFWTGLKPVPIPMLTTLTLGEYWIGIQNSSAITTAGSSIVPMVVSNLYVSYPVTTIGDWGRTSGSVSQSMIFNQGLGLASNTTATSLALSNVTATVPHRVYFNFSNYPLI